MPEQKKKKATEEKKKAQLHLISFKLLNPWWCYCSQLFKSVTVDVLAARQISADPDPLKRP